jgi:thiamine-phosphate pyrophosphorylase
LEKSFPKLQRQTPESSSLLLCYITDRSQFSGDESARRRRLLEKITEAARSGVDFIQLREKDLSARELELLAREAICAVREISPSTTQLLINSRVDVALAVGADGVHLRSDDISPSDARKILNRDGGAARARFTIGVSCHLIYEVRQAVDHADFVVYGPVFQKKTASGSAAASIEALHQACQEKIPVLALGGITLENGCACLQAGAAGIAGIRLFQENEVRKVVEALRSLPQLDVVD